jgi:hypothetical protein
MSDKPAEWLTTSEVAARLKISERTVQRRCKSDKLKCKRVMTEDGVSWQVDATSLPTGDDINDRLTPSDDGVTTGDDTQSVGSVASVPTGGAIGDDTRLGRVEGYVARDMELLIGRAVEDAVKAAQAPLLKYIEQLTSTQAPLAEYIEKLTAAHGSLSGRIEAQGAAHSLLMEELKQLRQDRATQTGHIERLTAKIEELEQTVAQEQPDAAEPSQTAMTAAIQEALTPYVKRAQSVAAAVETVKIENNLLKARLEMAKRPWWAFWKRKEVHQALPQGTPETAQGSTDDH